MTLPSQNRRTLIAAAHALRPVVLIGNRGLTPSVLAEIDRALTDHQLIKIKINTETREETQEIIEKITSGLGCEHLRLIGHIAILYRAKSD